MVNFNATANATEEFSAARNSLPTNIDEWQLTDQKRRAEIANQIVHRFSEGEGRSRLNRDGTPKPIKSWHGIMIMTSEEPLTSDNSFQGVKTRVLEIQADTIIGHVNSDRQIELNHDLCAEIWNIAQKNYGMLGAEFIENLLQEFNDDPHFKRLKTEYDINFDIIMSTREDRIIASYAQYLAIIACADMRIQTYFLGMDENEATKSTVEFIEFIATQLPSENSQLDTERAKLAIIDWTNAYADHFKKWKETDKERDSDPTNSNENQTISIDFCKDPCFGYWIRDDLYVIPSELDKALTDRGFSSRKIKKEWAQNGEIEVESSSDRLSILKTIEPGVRKRVIGLSFIHDAENEFTCENELMIEKCEKVDCRGTDEGDPDAPVLF